MTSTSTLTQQVTKLGNGVEVQNSGTPVEGKRKQIVEDVLNRSSKPRNIPSLLKWYGLPKVFSHSRTLMYKVISSTEKPNRIVYEQRQEYTFRLIGTKRAITSIIFIDLDENDKIVRLEDKWNGKDQPVRFGALWLRRLNAVTVPWFIGVPKYESQ
ncbi:hypothetical protein RhiLY_11987 [Ceratobasidium sp. AG-Ba]|nr:hypothetical protein RhiLY_11987 [Ceratobasidium sp. AG-Ba]